MVRHSGLVHTKKLIEELEKEKQACLVENRRVTAMERKIQNLRGVAWWYVLWDVTESKTEVAVPEQDEDID